MNLQYTKMKTLFLRQSYLDSWEEYQKSLLKKNYIRWDYLVLTASNEEQARGYREQIRRRLELGLLSDRTKYLVLPDPEGKRVGSGGATLHVLNELARIEKWGEKSFQGKRILIIHSGGDSKRIPQYSAMGKLFSPVPRTLPNGRASTLFDEFVIGMTGVPGRLREGVMVTSGDVLLLFNPLQIDFSDADAMAVSIKTPVETGKNHGVYLNNGNDYVQSFLHKQSEERLRMLGAVNDRGMVDLDTGAVILSSGLIQKLFSLISTKGAADTEKFNRFVNERSRVSFYGDFLYPLAENATLEEYKKEAPEGEFCDELLYCREKIWEVLKECSMKMVCLSPAEFIHFGTTYELKELMTKKLDQYAFLDWKAMNFTNAQREGDKSYAAYNSYISPKAEIGADTYLEHAYIEEGAKIGSGSILAGLRVKGKTIPEQVVMHGLKLKGNGFCVRMYGIQDNPKNSLLKGTSYLGIFFKEVLQNYGLQESYFWKEEDRESTDLWKAELFPVESTMERALEKTLLLYRILHKEATAEEVKLYLEEKRISLYKSYRDADVMAIIPWEMRLETEILAEEFLQELENRNFIRETLKLFDVTGVREDLYQCIMEKTEDMDLSMKLRVYHGLSVYAKELGIKKAEEILLDGEYLENLCFHTLSDEITKHTKTAVWQENQIRIRKEQVDVSLPVRVNWGGGWTDTPPYCMENGGLVLNAAIKLKGLLPVQVTVKRLEEPEIRFESADVGVKTVIRDVKEILDCKNPYDHYALHKSALIACGIIPENTEEQLSAILEELGGGIYLSTQVIGVPKGSGLGTSSILAAACVKAIFEFLGVFESQNMREEPDGSNQLESINITEGEKEEILYEVVLKMEQIMSTGGGWQDQVGGLKSGIKLISSEPGMRQELRVEELIIPEKTKKQLQDRFALIYTGQRRLARNLLRDVVGNYIDSKPESLEALHEMKKLAEEMKDALLKGDVNEFALLLSKHWEVSCKLDPGTTNTCINQIFLSCEELISGKFISGAGGGGFLQVILKEGITKEMLREKLLAVFEDSGVDVWDCEFIY